MHFCILLPHTGGTEQWITYSLRGTGLRHVPLGDGYKDLEVTPEELEYCGIYAAKIHYELPLPATWTFTSETA